MSDSKPSSPKEGEEQPVVEEEQQPQEPEAAVAEEEEDAPTAEELQEQIHQLEEQIRDRQRVLQEKIGDAEVSTAAAEAALKEAESGYQAAQEDLKQAELEKETILPQYERCQQNKDHHQLAENYKKEIEKTEEELREADAKIKGLESRLQTVSTTYKRERERRSLLVTRIATQVEELAKAVEQKVALTLPIDEASDAPQAQLCLQRLNELFRERESEINTWTRHGREMDAILEMKRRRALDLRLEADRQVALTAASKDEEIRAMILRFQEERTSLQKDIEATRDLNQQQLDALHRPRVVAEKQVTLSDPIGGPKKREMAASTTKVFSQRTKDLEKEKEEVLAKIRTTAAEKHKLLKATQDLKHQIELEQKKFATSLRNLESQILNERHQISDLESENSKLEEMCESLRIAVRTTG